MMDLLLEAWVSGLIELAKLKHMLGAGKRWKPGEKLKLLFCGYNGARNTGADVRVHEMLRQIGHVLGPERTQLSVLTLDREQSKGYFGDANQITLPHIFPPFLHREVPRHDGVIACEGSMFKSKFSDALTAMMVGALGAAVAQNRLSVGYGGEAGKMNRVPRWMTQRYCSDALVITRNEESAQLLGELGIATEVGTDTAWTFEPHGPEVGEKALRNAGWDGKAPVLALCPINPFWWPVRASVLKAMVTPLGAFKKSHYKSVYFHNSGRAVDEAFERYLRAIAGGLNAFRKKTNVFTVLIAMEQLDTRACDRLAPMIDGSAPVFSSKYHDMFKLVSILRACSMMISSRYHGIVTCMPGLVPSAGITMDERIRNLMRQREQQHLLMEVDQPDLEERVLASLQTLHGEADAIREGIGRTVARELRAMARMGVYLEDRVRQRYPEFPTRTGPQSWREYLPPISESLEALIDKYDKA